jgi:hypothetical protein
MEHIGLLKNNGTGVNPVYELTDFGWKLAHALRRWRAAGKNTASFRHEEYL